MCVFVDPPYYNQCAVFASPLERFFIKSIFYHCGIGPTVRILWSQTAQLPWQMFAVSKC